MSKVLSSYWVSILLVMVLIAIQYPLWFGRGGWLDVWHLDHLLVQANAALAEQQQALAIQSKKLNQDIGQLVEARARYELGYIGEGELFFRVVPSP